MKNIIFLFVFLFFCIQNINSQGWTLQNSGTSIQLNSVSASGNYYAWICGNNGTVLKTTNGGENWVNVSGNGIPSVLNLLNIYSHLYKNFTYQELNNVYATGTDNSGSYIYRTTNGGLNWTKVHTVTGNGARINSIWFRDTARGFAEGEPVSGRWSFWRTTNNGLTWDSTGLFLNGQNYSGFPNNLSGRITRFVDTLISIGAIYNNSESRIFRSTNFGSSWNTIIPGINKPMTSICFVNSSTGLIGGNNYVYKTTNSGTNWNLVSNLPFTPNLVGFATENLYYFSFYLKTDSSGLQSIYREESFGYWYVDLSGIRGLRHMQGANKIWAVGDSGKIYSKSILFPFVRKINSETPKNFTLFQNYPNPFNPTTIIKLDIVSSPFTKWGQGGFVTLKVYDITGHEVATLVNEQLEPGTYKVTFEGSNLPSGVYFYTLSAGDFRETKKMILMK